MMKEFQSVSSAIRYIAGENVTLDRKIRVHGGDINDAWKLSLSDGSSLFMKSNAIGNRDFFCKEVNGLSILKKSKCIGVPNIFAIGADEGENCAFLIMEFLEPKFRCKDYWRIFGRELASMHNASISSVEVLGDPEVNYGFFEDNYIGASIQKNSPDSSWISFYRDSRLLPQIKMAERYLNQNILKKMNHLLENLDKYLRKPEKGSVLHGDLWSGNVITGIDGKAWLIDPASYIGDSETDLAMTQLFGSFPAEFYEGYHEIWPISPEYKDRRPIYHLYHMLNHLNLFGKGYLAEVIDIVNHYV